jgi:hypothetical protein
VVQADRGWPDVPWLNVARPGNPSGAPLADVVAPCRDVLLSAIRVFEDHSYWDDDAFAQLVASSSMTMTVGTLGDAAS